MRTVAAVADFVAHLAFRKSAVIGRSNTLLRSNRVEKNNSSRFSI
jgi:hypothetical protein